MRLGQMQGNAVDKAAYQGAASGPQQLGADVQAFCKNECVFLAREQMTGQEE